MKRFHVAGITGAMWGAMAVTAGYAQRVQPPAGATPLVVAGDHFLLRGQPFQILSGELEYARIPRADWRDRLRKVRALGLNTITVYVFWNLHEPVPGQYDFSGQNDVAEFLREAQQEGLMVVLRPGPYVCAEWDLGGYPSWLLKQDGMLLRSTQPAYLEAVRRWMLRLGKELAPLQVSRGGPIIAVQVENEYGSFNVKEDRAAYLEDVRQIVVDAGFGESLLYTADGGDVMDKGSIPGVFAAVDYGTGDEERSIALLKKFSPNAPVYAAEYWDGWFDHWGEKHQVTDAVTQEKEIRAVIEKGYSINLYMVHGGTTFGWMNGANSGGLGYQPDVSSYDYDAPLDESGRPRPKYFALREMIREVTHRNPPPVPVSAPLITIPAVTLRESASLWARTGAAKTGDAPITMEKLDQAYGYVLYRHRLTAAQAKQGELKIDGLHSYARVYLDGHLLGVIDRRLGQDSIAVDAKAGQRLDLLVENSGRINFTTAIRGERAGILGAVSLGGTVLAGWESFADVVTEPAPGDFKQGDCTGPCFYRASLEVQQPGDTYLNTTNLGKGVVWVNGHLLGRFWNVGPMGSLFLPGVWLHAGSNTLTVFDLNGGSGLSVRGETAVTYLTPGPERTSPSTEPVRMDHQPAIAKAGSADKTNEVPR
jgi:beta-galactosidase